MNIKIAQLLKRLIPTVALTLGVAALAAAQHNASVPQASVVTQPQDSVQLSSQAAPAVSPHITVNGKQLRLNSEGQIDVALPGGGSAHVDVVGDQTGVTTSHPSSGPASNGSTSSNLNVSVQSVNSGGVSHSTMNLHSSSNSLNGTSSHSTTHVFSTGSAHVEVTSP